MQVRYASAADKKETVYHTQELGDDVCFLNLRLVLEAMLCAAWGMVWRRAQPEPCNPLRCWSLLYLLKNISLNTLSRLVRPFHLASVMLTGRCCQCEDIRKLLTWMSIQLQVYLIKGTFADLWVSTVCQSFGSNKALLLQQAQLVSHEFKELLP